jgi:SAM-dependent methyltransferase
MERVFYPRYYELEGRHWWFVGRRVILTELLRRRLHGRTDVRALDFGCGSGTFLEQLDAFGRPSGVDVDVEAVRFCHERGRTDVRHVPAEGTLPFTDGAFDLVTSLDVLEHIDDDIAAVRELRRVLGRDGVLLVAVPAFGFLWGDQDEISHHRRRYTGGTLRTVLERGGFDVEHVSYFNTLLFPAIAAVRLARRAVRAPRADCTDFDVGPSVVNGLLARLFAAEVHGVVRRRGLPVGVSVLALAHPA